MTEYDYSPEAVERYQHKMRGIYDWVRDTERATSPTSSPPRTSPTSYSKPRSVPLAAPIPVVPIPAPQLYHHHSSPQSHPHHHRRHHSRSRDDARTHSRSRSNSTSTRHPPSRSRTYSYATQAAQTPYGSIPVASPTPRRGMTHPGYSTQQPNPSMQYVTYDPTKPLIINSNGVRVEYSYGSPHPAPVQPRQPPLLKRLFTSFNWRPSRPQSAQLETRSPPTPHAHSRAKSRDAGRERERERDRRRHRRQSLP